MAVLPAIQPLYVVSGVVVGMLVGMTGVGGGSLMTPLLILLFGIHPLTAVGTDLLYASATKTCGTIRSWLQQDHRLARRRSVGDGQHSAHCAHDLCSLETRHEQSGGAEGDYERARGRVAADRAVAVLPQNGDGDLRQSRRRNATGYGAESDHSHGRRSGRSRVDFIGRCGRHRRDERC